MSSSLVARLTGLVLLAGGLALLPTPSAVAAGGRPLDLASVRVVNTDDALTLKFRWHTTFKGKEGGAYWWGGFVGLDTDPDRPGPEYGVDISNQCGVGYAAGPIVDGRIDGSWGGGCGETLECAETVALTYTKTGSALRSIVITKKAGCYDESSVAVNGLFRSGPYGELGASYDKGDVFPGKNLGVFSEPVETSTSATVQDNSEGLKKLKPSMAP